MDRIALEKACFERKSKSRGGLDAGELRRAILKLDPNADISVNRPQLEALCRGLLGKATGPPKMGTEVDLPPEPESPAMVEEEAKIPGERRQVPIFYAGHPTKETRKLVEEKYCSCIFKLLGKHGDPS